MPDARFVIAGEGELRQSLERQIKDHHLEKHVFLAGFRPDVLSVHKAFDIFVMSSVTEGLGTSLLDAMACGKPIVATTAGGMPEVVKDGKTGILVPPRDHEAMAEAIVRLLTDDDARQAMGEAGQARARVYFSAERMVQDTYDVYRRVALHPHVEDSDETADGGGTRSQRSRRSRDRFLCELCELRDLRGRGRGPSLPDRHERRLAARVVARAVVEGDGGGVVRERHAAGDAAGRGAVGVDQETAPRFAPVPASNKRSW